MSFLTDKAKQILGILDKPMEMEGETPPFGPTPLERWKATQETKAVEPEGESKPEESAEDKLQKAAIAYQKQRLEEGGVTQRAAPTGEAVDTTEQARITQEQKAQEDKEATAKRYGGQVKEPKKRVGF